jgi:putative peptidoglycan lipid II flippase
MKKTAIIIMLLTVISKIFGLLRDIVLSYYYGASIISDAYLIAITISSVVFGFIVSGVSTGYIPLYRKIENKSGIEEGNKFTNNLVNILLVLSTFIVIVGLIFTDELVGVFASGFEGKAFTTSVIFTRVSLLSIYFTGLITLFSGYLQLHDNYSIPALIGLPLNFFTILSIYVSANTDSIYLAIGTVIATGFQLILLLPYVYKKGYIYKPIISLKDDNIKKLGYIALPVIIGLSINQINVLVDRTIASQIATGGISALNYAYRLNLFVHGIFVLSISTAIYPLISKMAVDKNMQGFKKTVGEAITGINMLVIPATIGSMIFAKPIIILLFGRGEFDNLAISMTSDSLFYYSVGMIGIGLREVLSRAFYSLQDTKTPMINAGIAVVMNIILNIVLSKVMGLGGLALATSLSAIFGSFLLFFSLRKKIGAFGLKKVFSSFLKVTVGSLLMAIIAKYLYISLLFIGSSYSLLISICIGAIIYFIIIYFLRVEEMDFLINSLKRRIKK